jgi:DNA repair protein RecO (recombination protein O)
MTSVTTEGIVLQLHPLTDSSLIVTWLTRDHGKLKTVAKAAKRPNSPFAGQIDLFYVATLTYAESKRSELHTLREVKLMAQPERLRKDYNALKVAGKLAEFLGKTLEPEYPDPELYEMCKSYLATLESGDNARRETLRTAIWKHLK